MAARDSFVGLRCKSFTVTDLKFLLRLIMIQPAIRYFAKSGLDIIPLGCDLQQDARGRVLLRKSYLVQ